MPLEGRGTKYTTMRIRLDKIQLFSSLETYLNYETSGSNIVATGTIPASSGVVFGTVVNIDRANTRQDVYAKNLGTGTKMPVIGGPRVNPYTPVAGIQASLITGSDSTSVTTRLLLFNTTGSPINVGSQTLEISVVQYQVPTSPI